MASAYSVGPLVLHDIASSQNTPPPGYPLYRLLSFAHVYYFRIRSLEKTNLGLLEGFADCCVNGMGKFERFDQFSWYVCGWVKRDQLT